MDFGRSLEGEVALPRQRLVLHADGLGIEILGASVHGAEIALAAVERGGHSVIARGEAQRLHGAMRLNRMAEQEARAELGAEAALIASRAADLGHMMPGRVVPLE